MELTRAQQAALDQLFTTDPKDLRQLRGVKEVTLQALVKKGLIRKLRDGWVRWSGGVVQEMPPEHQFAGVTVDEWEDTVVRNAVHFTCGRSLHDGSWNTTEHKTLREAITKAKTGQ